MGLLTKKTKQSRVTGRDNLWILKLINNSNAVAGLNRNMNDLFGKDSDTILSKGLCVVCKGSRSLCGKTRCPLMVRLNSYLGMMSLVNGTHVDGASPHS